MNTEESWEKTNLKDLRGKAWSLRPDQDPRTMECLGTITHQGVNYKYYKNTEGEILYDSEPEGGKPDWMLRADRASRKKHGIYSR